jgi:DNA-binding transcriptional regulator PaaX
MNFMELYPFTAKEAVYTPLIFRVGVELLNSMPYPSLAGIRDLAYYSGISDSAVRTTISRGKSNGSILVFKDSQDVSRYQLSQAYFEMGMTTISRDKQPEGFIVAVFSFTKDAVSERAVVRDTLKNYGFKRIAQNTYINGRIETKGLLGAMKDFGLEKNLYLFQCPDIDDLDLLNKILELFDIQNRMNLLQNFYSQMVAFLTEEGLSDEEIGCRMLYFGAVYWTVCQVDEPPIPAKYLPNGYPLQKINEFYNDFMQMNMVKLVNYYLKVNS